MATNPYFSDQYLAPLEDQSLAEDLIIEAIYNKGIDHFYLPRTLTNFDKFFGEDQASAFQDAIAVEMYLESVQSWQDDGSFLSKFGLEIRDSAKLVVSIKRFSDKVTARYPGITRPREGDVIALPSPIDKRTRFFEITFVNPETPFYQLGKLYTYTMTVKNFEFNGEKFETGNATLDAYTPNHSLITDLTMAPNGAGAYVTGEVVSQAAGWSAVVVAFSNGVLSVSNVKGELDDTLPILGDSSNSVYSLFVTNPGVHVDGIAVSPVNNDAMLNDTKNIDNAVVGGMVDFSEANPFSE